MAIRISKKLKRKLDWSIIGRDKDYDAYMWALVHLMEAYIEASEKYPYEMEKLRNIFKRKRRAFLDRRGQKAKG